MTVTVGSVSLVSTERFEPEAEDYVTTQRDGASIHKDCTIIITDDDTRINCIYEGRGKSLLKVKCPKAFPSVVLPTFGHHTQLISGSIVYTVSILSESILLRAEEIRRL